MVAYVQLLVVSATFHSVGELQPPEFNIDRLCDPTDTRQWESNLAENIDEHGAVIKNDLFSGAKQVVDHCMKWAFPGKWKRGRLVIILGVQFFPSIDLY